MEDKKHNEAYEEYFNNRTVADIMEEWGEHRDEWKPVEPKTEEKTKS